MKSSIKIVFVFAFLILLSCKHEPKIDYATVTFKVKNHTKTEHYVYYGYGDFYKKSPITKEGILTDTIRDFSTSFQYSIGSSRFFADVEKGDNITISFDQKDINNTISFTGQGYEKSAYLYASNKIEDLIFGNYKSFYSKEETVFLKNVEEIKLAQETLLENAEGLSEDYKKQAKKNINYNALNYLCSYEGSYSFYGKKENFKASDAINKRLNKIDVNNEQQFKVSDEYNILLTSLFRDKSRKARAKKVNNSKKLTSVYSEIQNQYIKNEMFFRETKSNIKYARNLDGYYNLFIAENNNEDHHKIITPIYKELKKLDKGSASPKFVNYENHAGGTTSLDDLKGKYVYIDVWATWCGPCKGEIPFLKEVEKKHHGKNIEFVSLSVDKQKDAQKWRDMVKEKELTGIQLLADKDFDSDFVKSYLISGIPRFILLDPNGNIVDNNAPRPSDKKLIELFNQLNI